MLMREENLNGSLEGLCVSCKTPQKIPFRDEWYVDSLYKIGACPSCKYEHQILIRKA